MELIREACDEGARKEKACELLGLTLRTVQRWERHGTCDQRKGSRAVPANKLSESEREKVLEIANSPEFADSSPSQIVPTLADQGTYVCSESTFHRILREEKMNAHRQMSKPNSKERPEPYVATAPNQVWSWDITYLPTQTKGLFLYMYMVLDIYSRKIVGCQVFSVESGDLASELIMDACLREGISKDQLVLHSDNGAPMKSATMLAKLQELGVVPSFSRPSVSDDNPFSESAFRTMKYHPTYPHCPFSSLESARQWADGFVHWYNHHHLHSGIRFVPPSSRHDGKDVEILKRRHEVYQLAKERHPERWSGKTRNWDPVESVALNKGKPPRKEMDKDVGVEAA